MNSNPAVAADDSGVKLSVEGQTTPVPVPAPRPSAIASHPAEAVSMSVTTTSPGTDLLESVGVLAAGAALPLIAVGGWFVAAAAVTSVLALMWAGNRRRAKARANEDELRAPRYMFSAEQLATALASSPPPEARGVFEALQPDETVSQWQLAHLLTSHMGDGRGAEILPLVLRYARRLA
jgi:hypothetical protein